MSEHTFSKTTGNFRYTVTMEVADNSSPLDRYLKENGIVREIQGPVLAGWEKSIAYPNGKRKDMPKVTDEVTGELRDWSRNDIPFSTENAAALEKAVGSFKIDIGTANADGDHVKNLVDNGILDVQVEEYEGAAKAVPKFAAEKKIVNDYLAAMGGLLKSGAPRTIATYSASPSHGRGELPVPTEPWEEDVEFLSALRDLVRRKALETATPE